MSDTSPPPRRTTQVIVAGLAVVLLFGAEAASAFLSANTIDELATYKLGGRLVRVTGPIACTRGERVAIRVAVRQPATAARARSRWNGRCTGAVQHWQVRARARGASSFQNGHGRVCAVATTRGGSRVSGLFHKSGKQVTDRILHWLDDHDL